MKMQKRSNPLRQQQLQPRGPSPGNSGGDKGQRFWPCPVCNRSFPLFRLEEHVNQCLDTSHCSPTSRSRPLTTKGDVSCKPPAVELCPAASTQQRSGRGRGECHDVQTPPSASFSVSPVKVHKLPLKETNKSSFTDSDSSRSFSDAKIDVVHCSVLERPPLTQQQEAHRLPMERCSTLEDNLLRPFNEKVVNVVHCPGLQRAPLAIARQQDASYLPSEWGLSLEANLLQQPANQNVVEVGRQGNFPVELEDGGKAKLRCKVEYTGMNHHRAEDLGTGEDIKDGGDLGEKGIAEDLRNGNGLAVDKPPVGFKLFQRQVQSQARLSMFRNFSSAPLQRKPSVTVLQPGMVLFRSWLDLDTQQKFVQESQDVSHLFHRPTTSGGGKYHIYSMCWGPKWDTKAHRYVAKGSEHPIPPWMFELSQKLAHDAQQHTSVYPEDCIYAPDVGLVNFYPVKADELGVIGLGGHQDLDDSDLMPVVSVSVGDSMTFFYRRFPPFSRRKSGISISVDEEAVRSCEDGDAAHNREHQILLESGDVLVFGGKSRLVYHGTRHVQPGTRPPGLHMVPGRLNFTFRQTIAKAI